MAISKIRVARYFLFLVAFIVLDLLFGTILMPGFVKNYFEIYTLNPYYNQGFEKNKTGVLRCKNFNPIYYTNSLGLRDKEVRQIPLTSSKRRVMFIGDSFTEGIGYNYDSTFCGYLENELDSSKTEVLNAGISGSSPKLYYLRLDYLFNQEHLKINDVYCLLGYESVPDELVYQNFKPRIPDLKDGYLLSLKRFLITHSAVYVLGARLMLRYYSYRNNLNEDERYLFWVKCDNRYNEQTGGKFSDFRGRWATNEMAQKEVTKRALDIWNKSLKDIEKLCLANGVKFHIVVYPMGFFIHNDIVNTETTNQMKSNFLSACNEVAKSNDIELINLFPLFYGGAEMQSVENKNRYYIQGDNHWNSCGHKRAADSLTVILNR